MRGLSKLCALTLGVVLCCALTGCAGQPPSPTEIPQETVAPTPTPTPEPPLPAGWAVTVDGTKLPGGSVIKDGLSYVKLDEVMDALGLEAVSAEANISFIWRRQDVSLALNSSELSYGQESFTMAAPVMSHRGESYIPVEDFCQALDISLFYDEEMEHLYCTPGAGDWDLPEGYKVLVPMYHGVSNNTWTMPTLFVRPDDMEAQIKYLLEEGFDLIWFEDLEHVDEYEKPVILTFDDGYVCNYEELLPILEKYQVKATFFIVSDFADESIHYMTWDMIRELEASGLASIQSHTQTHPYLDTYSRSSQERELVNSKLEITRQIGKEPFVLCYPSGAADGNTMELTALYYRFGLKMTGSPYHTGDDPTLVWRQFVSRDITMEQYKEIMNR